LADRTVYLPLIPDNRWQVTETPFGLHTNFLSPTVVLEVSRLGASWERIPFYWSDVEPANTTPDRYRWNPYVDAALAQLADRRVRPILVLAGNPEWAATHAGGPIDRVPLDELVQFMVAAVTRYSTAPYNVHHWEIYNEPDNLDELYADHGGWGYFGHRPEAYVELLRRLYGPIKAVDPQAQILLGGLAYDNWTTDDPPANFAPDFLDKVLAQGGGAYFDLLNFHYFPHFRNKWEPYGPGLVGKANALRQKLAAYGLDKPLICTETSVVSSQPNGDELQSRYLAQGFAQGLAAGLEATLWYRLYDPPPEVQADRYGLIDGYGNPKPAYYAYQTLTRQLTGARYLRTLGPAETGSGQIEAYEFRAPGAERLLLAWTNDGQTHPLVLEAGRVVAVDKLGGQTALSDGTDGRWDGRTEVKLGPSPLYLHVRP
jgi:hypothetical protein